MNTLSKRQKGTSHGVLVLCVAALLATLASAWIGISALEQKSTGAPASALHSVLKQKSTGTPVSAEQSCENATGFFRDDFKCHSA